MSVILCSVWYFDVKAWMEAAINPAAIAAVHQHEPGSPKGKFAAVQLIVTHACGEFLLTNVPFGEFVDRWQDLLKRG